MRFLWSFLILMIVAQSSFAFDGKRKGLIAGVGLGLHGLKFDQTFRDGDYSAGAEVKRNGFAPHFKLGYAPNKRVEIYLCDRHSFYSSKSDYHGDITYNNRLMSVGISAFAPVGVLRKKEWSESLIFSAGYGITRWNMVTDVRNLDLDLDGNGFFLGFGMEFKKHVRWEFIYQNQTAEDSKGDYYNKFDANVYILTMELMAF